jgi:hypothetical protein
MDTSSHGQLPTDLVQAQQRFQAWRGQRTPGTRIPQSLWAIAVKLAKVHGVSRTAAALRLDDYRLKQRAEEVALVMSFFPLFPQPSDRGGPLEREDPGRARAIGTGRTAIRGESTDPDPGPDPDPGHTDSGPNMFARCIIRKSKRLVACTRD